jgi:hypothetical protein
MQTFLTRLWHCFDMIYKFKTCSIMSMTQSIQIKDIVSLCTQIAMKISSHVAKEKNKQLKEIEINHYCFMKQTLPMCLVQV